jgi:GntR family transcriptional regulator, transcriptional repressor for pyruvate dehydrogenase complex
MDKGLTVGESTNNRQAVGFKPVPQRRAFEEIFFQIEDAILEGRLGVGDRLPPERELAEIFQVSRPSVREALRVLETLGVLSSRRGTGADSGSIVSAGGDNGLGNLLRLHASLLKIPLTDLLDVREAMEMYTFRAAALRITPEGIAQINEIVERMPEAEDSEAFLELDTEFHLTIARLSGNAVAPLIMTALREAIARQMKLAFEAIEDWPTEHAWLVKEHRMVAATIAEGDGERAARAASQHIRAFYGRVLSGRDAPAPRPAPRRSAGASAPAGEARSR